MTTITDPAARAHFLRDSIPPGGFFAGQDWRISLSPFPLGPELARSLESLGRVLLQFNRAVNLLYRKSLEGSQPSFVAQWLDQGKPPELLEIQRAAALKAELPRVIRPDIILHEAGPCIAELDSVPGGIGLTAWLNQTYSAPPIAAPNVIGGPDGMLRGFAGIFGAAKSVHIVISQEAQTYRPEMAWLAGQLGEKFQIRDPGFTAYQSGDAVYRFFELFDLPNIPAAKTLMDMALEKKIRLTPPPKPVFEEKMLFALLWNRNLRPFWRQELGEGFLDRLQRLVPYSWMVDPAPLPPQGAFPQLNLTDWSHLKLLSQRERELILKISGFSDKAWGARGVHLGADLSTADWSAAVDEALRAFPRSPYVLQRYLKPRLVESHWYDFDKEQSVAMPGRVRLCPYYFVTGDGDAARAALCGVLATICPADKKIIHGMSAAILAPCSTD
jgi:hypothetical protein